jgi:flagellar secretion chaperone FliS
MDVGRSYREAAVRGASPVELVIRLYEQMIEDLRQAVKALEQNDVERRSNKINHAILVLAHLQSQLEFQAGGKVARDLETFYNVLRQNLVQAQVAGSRQLLAQQITDLLAVREAWSEVQRAEYSSVAKAPGPIPEDASISGPGHAHVDWKG